MTKTSRFNYIKRGLVGVCAATMLTGLCAGSAFGTGSVDTTGSVDGTSGEANTIVKAKSETANISATVPTAMTVSIAPDGTLTFPDNTSFVIGINAGGWPLKVSDVALTPAGSYHLATTDAFAEQDSNLYLAMNNGTADVPLKADTNTSAVSNLAQTASGAEDLGVTMKGKVKNPSYQTTASEIVTMKWTIAPVQ
ncbi:MAG TPA: hypothetical protein K8W22_13360 [Gordonibacter urolithinfaciens]|uniref:hypothetical protein n=1 Tax=Gordonibacter urolithinfaciens TaxID=1335613 RepID=UPI001DF917D1|nr:hypothetical protein [Gordonibacter urolithinfaciens]HJF64435.1 hypothetical protein [Gordonibacter urolithinfaciens]